MHVASPLESTPNKNLRTGSLQNRCNHHSFKNRAILVLSCKVCYFGVRGTKPFSLPDARRLLNVVPPFLLYVVSAVSLIEGYFGKLVHISRRTSAADETP